MISNKKALYLVITALLGTQFEAFSSSRGGSSSSRGSGSRGGGGSSGGRGGSSSSRGGGGSSGGRGGSSSSRGGGGSSSSRGASAQTQQSTVQQSAAQQPAGFKLLVQPGDVATDAITDPATVDPLLLANASVVTRDPMMQADINNLIQTQIKPLYQLMLDSKATLQSGAISAEQISGLRGRFIQLISTAPVIVKVPTMSNISTNTRIVSGQADMGTATIPVVITELDANKYTNQQLANMVLVTRKGITTTQFDDISVIRWGQKLKPLVEAAKTAAAQTPVNQSLKAMLKDILSTGWADAFVPQPTMAETILTGQANLTTATIQVTAANVANLFDDQLAKLVIKSVPNLTKAQFDTLAAQIQTNIAPNITNPAALRTNLPALLNTNQIVAFVAPHVEVAPTTVPETVLIGQANLTAATIQVTAANVANLFDDQLAKLVIKSVPNLTKAQFDTLAAQIQTNVAPNATNPAALKTNLPALLNTNQIVAFVAPHVETMITTPMILTEQTSIDGLVVVPVESLANLTTDQVATIALVSKPNITDTDLANLKQAIASNNVVGGINMLKTSKIQTLANQIISTIKGILTQGATAGKADVYAAPAATPIQAGNNALALVQAIVIPTGSTTLSKAAPETYTIASRLSRGFINVRMHQGASDQAAATALIKNINDYQTNIKTYYANALPNATMNFDVSAGNLASIKGWLEEGLSKNLIDVDIDAQYFN